MGFDLTDRQGSIIFWTTRARNPLHMLCCTVPIGLDRSGVVNDPIHGCVRNSHGLQCVSTVFVEARVNELSTSKPNSVTHSEVAEENTLGIRCHHRHCLIL